MLLTGLLLNAALGWSCADPVVGLVMAAVAVREGRGAWCGESCGCVPVVGPAADGCTCVDGCDCDDC